MTKHFISTKTRHDNTFATDAIVRVRGASRLGGPGGWGIGGWNEKTALRHVYQGPLVEGPQAYLFGLPAVIDTNGGTAAEQAAAAEAGLLFDVEDGDTLVIDGVDYRLSVNPRGYPKLTPA